VKDNKKGCIHLDGAEIVLYQARGRTRSEIPPRADIPGDAVI